MQHRGADEVAGQEATTRAVTVLEHPRMGWVLAWGDEPPVFSIGYAEPIGPGDSGFSVLFSNAPDPADVPENGEHPLVGPMHGHCLLEEYPEVAEGLEVAREFGAADLDDDGEWVGRRLSAGGASLSDA